MLQTARPQRFRGQSVVEFALVSLLLMTMVAGVIDLGRGVYTRTTLSNAVREAARYGATDPSDTDGMIAAANSASPGLKLAVEPNLKKSFANNGGIIRCTDRNYAWQPSVDTNKLVAPAALGLGVVAPALAAQAVAADTYDCVSSYYFLINGSIANPPQELSGQVRPGDTVRVVFTIAATCSNVVASLTSWRTDSEKNIIEPLPFYQQASGTFNAGRYYLEVQVPNDNFKIQFSITSYVTVTPTPIPTATSTPTNTPIPTATKTNTPVPTATKTPLPTSTATNTPVPTATSTPGPTNTPTKTEHGRRRRSRTRT